ncbi:internalin [Vallitalea longa]|uniref:Internalin n=1 Tax=Vallitalea longa TaxID=2936439 RepID=A0A9W6DG79_9FIRM|nr:hypothetical protein [Vallitalea longa]GKX29464.1 internalin [Vallitalea longa]
MIENKGLDYYLQWSSRGDQVDEKCLTLIEISGNQISYEEIDEIKKYPNKIEIQIRGLTQETFEYFVNKYGQQFKIIYFWKCSLVTDFSCLEQLTDVEYIMFYWNQRVTHLWDLSKNTCLKGLAFDDFTRMHTLEEIHLAPMLEELNFGNILWSTYILLSLKPLTKCKKLRSLTFSAKKIEDNDITPLVNIENLEELEFPTNLFPTEQVALLTAKLKNVSSTVFAPYIELDSPIEHNDKNLDVLVIGKRKPYLDSKKDKKRLEKYEENFWKLVSEYEEKENL